MSVSWSANKHKQNKQKNKQTKSTALVDNKIHLLIFTVGKKNITYKNKRTKINPMRTVKQTNWHLVVERWDLNADCWNRGGQRRREGLCWGNIRVQGRVQRGSAVKAVTQDTILTLDICCRTRANITSPPKHQPSRQLRACVCVFPSQLGTERHFLKAAVKKLKGNK